MSGIKGPILFVIAWVSVTSMIVASIVKKDKTEVKGEVVAVLEKAGKKVQLKPDAQILWRDVEAGQVMTYNDMISTSSDSFATINIKNAKTFVLGPDSIFTIRAPKGNKKNILIDLQKGYLEAKKEKVKKKNKNFKTENSKKAEKIENITILGGGKEYTLSAKNAEFSIFKDKGQSDAKVLSASGEIKVKKKGEKKAVKLEKVVAKKDALLALRTVEKPKSFKIDLPEFTDASIQKKIEKDNRDRKFALFLSKNSSNNLLPVVVAPKSNWVGWSFEPLASVYNSKINVILSPNRNAKKPKDRDWIPALFYDKSKRKSWRGENAFKKQVIEVNLKDVDTFWEGRVQDKKFEEINVALSSVVFFSRGENPLKKVAPKKIKIALKSLANHKASSLKVSIKDWKFVRRSSGLIWQKDFVPKSSIYLEKGTPLRAVYGLIHTGNFSIEEALNKDDKKKVHFVKRFRVVASIEGDYEKAANVSRLRRLLRADFAFEGRKRDFIGNYKAYQKLASSNVKFKKLFVYNNGAMVEVNKKFLEGSKALRKFLVGDRSAYFRSKARIVGDFR